jgi:hypothetical protein
MSAMRPSRRASAVAFLAVALAAASFVGGTAAAVAAARETPQQFLTKLAAAFRAGDTKFLVQRLNPAVIARYGTPLCRGYVSTLHDPTRKITVQQVGKPGPFDYASGGKSTTVPKTVAVTVQMTSHGQHNTQTVHIALHGKRYSWFATCEPTGADAVARALGPYTGTYTGAWRDTHFHVNGTMKIVVSIDTVAKQLDLSLTFTGPLFGATAPSTEQLAPVSTDITEFGQPVRGTSKIFGPYVVTYTALGTVIVNMPQCPAGACTLTGTLEPGTFSGNVVVKLRDGTTSQGTVKLAKQ